jgi:hypothetical protein
MKNDFWNYLFESSKLIDNAANDRKAVYELVSARLETIELLYERSFDPVDSYEEFVAVKLIKAISQVIKK